MPPRKVPLFAVGYTGWKTLETVEEKVKGGAVDGILILDSELFAATPGPVIESGSGWQPYSTRGGSGAAALWAFLCCLTEALHGMASFGQVFDAYGLLRGPEAEAPPS